MTETSILEIAEQLVKHDRGNDYGHPLDDFTRTAAIWTAMFDMQFTAHDVAYAMIAVKLSRLMQTQGHLDSLIDIAGYCRCSQLVQEEKERRAGL